MGSASLKVTEPSMEEILASIRRIIADDQEAIHVPEADEPAFSPLRNVLDLAEQHVRPILPAEELSQAKDAGTAEAASRDDAFPEEGPVSISLGGYEEQQTVAEPVLANGPASGTVPGQASGEDPKEALLSSQARASVSESFGRLGAALMPSQPQTVEDLMKEMLRPMLKAWLDDNLPSIVERLVQAEIERAARGRG